MMMVRSLRRKPCSRNFGCGRMSTTMDSQSQGRVNREGSRGFLLRRLLEKVGSRSLLVAGVQSDSLPDLSRVRAKLAMHSASWAVEYSAVRQPACQLHSVISALADRAVSSSPANHSSFVPKKRLFNTQLEVLSLFQHFRSILRCKRPSLLHKFCLLSFVELGRRCRARRDRYADLFEKILLARW